ncbi:MAG: glycosyltransferase [Prolixibacteraceae bacterium]|nr:glycosyltransferase [Prolixibacteraceae bacterium]
MKNNHRYHTNRKYKILLAIGSSEIGGAQNIFLSCAGEFVKLGHVVEVALPEGPLSDQAKLLGIPIHTINFTSILSVLRIKRMLQKGNYDIINTYLTKCGLLVSFVNFLYKNPICCTLLNAITHEKLIRIQKLIYPLMYHLFQMFCDGIIVNSNANKQHFVDTAKIKESHIQVIYSGIDEKRFKNNTQSLNLAKKIVIGIVGRLSMEKGPVYLINALEFLKDIDYECMIVGDGPLRNDLEKRVDELGLNKRVKFFGFQKEVAQFIKKMDVVVVPSLNETFGLTIVEAFLMKKVVIASNVGGIPELVIHRKTGLLFPAKDSVSIANSIQIIYENRNLAKRLTESAYRHAISNFTIPVMVNNTLNYYAVLLERQEKIITEAK